MTDDLYERYKEALRVGHVAVLRGSLEDAIDAYRRAAEIAPSRALPHTSLGGVLLRLGHLEEALVEYAVAVARAPHDEGALLGQSEALTMAGQRVDAALALDHVSEIQEAAGRLPEAADTLRRALELEDTAERSRRQRGLLRQIRLSEGDQAAEHLLARALRLRDEPSGGRPEGARMEPMAAALAGGSGVEPSAASLSSGLGTGYATRPQMFVEAEPLLPASESPIPAETSEAAAIETVASGAATGLPEAAEPAEAELQPKALAILPTADEFAPAAPADLPEVEPTSAAGPIVQIDAQSAELSQPAPTAVPAVAGAMAGDAPVIVDAGSLVSVPEAIGVMEGALDTAVVMTAGDSQRQPTGDELLAAVEAADLAGDATTLRSLLLWTARAYAREGRFELGLDAADRLLQTSPDDVDAHLVLVELYLARDWNTLAAEKLALLGRLAELNDDEETRQRLCAVASRAFPRDERLAALCS